MDSMSINIFAVAITSLVTFAVGSLWYSVLFGKVWMKENGFSEEDFKDVNMFKVMGGAYILSLIICYNLAAFLGPEPNFIMGMIYGFLTGAGWVSTSIGIMFLYEKKSIKLFLIHAGYNTLTYTIMGGILGVWK
ncbi:MAG: DUF1761 domain-containing protein [Ignavibacteriaceae bacterium]|nr:DUF1761 domain-containing protein [Ignavibacteriaceae bacterium]HRI45939.1 DUF1761 domain-containing protein [Ignavibacteriaceae bacterium]